MLLFAGFPHRQLKVNFWPDSLLTAFVLVFRFADLGIFGVVVFLSVLILGLGHIIGVLDSTSSLEVFVFSIFAQRLSK